MDAITMLTEQHTKVRTLFEAFGQARGYSQKTAVFEDLADELSLHTTIEEKIFYPAAYAGQGEQALEDAIEAHQDIRQTVSDLMDLSANTEDFSQLMRTLREQVERHVADEEKNLFPAVRARLGDRELHQLCVQMETLYTGEALKGATRNLPGRVSYTPELSPG